MEKLQWKTEVRKLSDLIPVSYNPRSLSDKQAKDLKKSLLKFSLAEIPVINLDNTILAGHQRCKILAQIENKDFEIDVRVPNRQLTPEEANEYLIRSNKNSGEFDFELLENHFSTDDLVDWGFDEDEFEHDVDALGEVEGEDDVPDAPEDPVTRLGDVWLLGDHRLLCGDATSIDAVDKLMDGQEPNTMITDPPYGVKYEASWRAEAKGRIKTEREKSSNLMNDERSDWYDAYVLFKGSVAYVWHADKFTDVVMDGLRRAGFDIKQQIIWNKNVHALSRSDYHFKHEPCWYAVKPKGDRNWKGGRTQMSVWDIPFIIFEKTKTAHPTQKPVEIYTRSLEHHTNQGEYVYDPFGGSGTLIIACEKLKRRALSIELDPKYCDIIIKRWQEFTGNEAVHAESGKKYNEF